MYIFTLDRDQIIQKTEPLFIVPNVRKSIFSGNRYLVSINLYHGTDFIADYETDEEARQEMDAINNCTDEVYFIGGYQGRDLSVVRRLNTELGRFLGHA